MNRVPLVKLSPPRPSLMSRVLRHKLLLVLVGGFFAWTHAPSGTTDDLTAWFVQELAVALGADAGDLADDALADAWRPASSDEIDDGDLELFAPVIDLICGNVCEIRGGRLHFEQSDRYAHQLESVDQG